MQASTFVFVFLFQCPNPQTEKQVCDAQHEDDSEHDVYVRVRAETDSGNTCQHSEQGKGVVPRRIIVVDSEKRIKPFVFFVFHTLCV